MKKLISSRISKLGYEIRKEIFEGVQMISAYTPSGKYIGNPKDALFLFKKLGITFMEPSKFENNVCNIGYSPLTKKWYGWSHRACVGFTIGNKIFEEKFGNDKTLFIKHGKLTIKTLADAKLAAINFADYIS